jgi:C4-dicarboxylate transporter DctM subunit
MPGDAHGRHETSPESGAELSPAVIGIIGIVVLIIVFILGMPVGFAMALVGFLGFSYIASPAAGLSLLARDIFTSFSSYSLTVIPMFLLMGAIAYVSGMSQRLYAASHVVFGRLRGGLALTTIGACALFAAICGSTVATAATMGRVAIPEMKRYGYDDALASGTVAAAGSLGILIPPSTIFVVYGILTEQSIGKLFIAGIVPGIVLAGLFFITVAILCWHRPHLAPLGEPTSYREKIAGLFGISEMVILFLLVMGGLFLGWFSPTQAGAAGAAGAIIISLAHRTLTWSGFLLALKDTVKVTCEVMVIIAGAVVLGHFIALTRIPLTLTTWVGGLELSPAGIMGIMILMYLFAGTFMDALALVSLTIPIVYPVVLALGFDPIWFGVIIVLVTQMGVITPPVGINVYAVRSIAGNIPLATIFKGAMPFLIALLVMTGILIVAPQLATFLPDLIRY